MSVTTRAYIQPVETLITASDLSFVGPSYLEHISFRAYESFSANIFFIRSTVIVPNQFHSYQNRSFHQTNSAVFMNISHLIKLELSSPLAVLVLKRSNLFAYVYAVHRCLINDFTDSKNVSCYFILSIRKRFLH